MKPRLLLAGIVLGFAAMAQTFAEDEGVITWHNAVDIGIEGKGWTDTETPYDRLPARANGVVRPPVWSLSQDTAGMCVRFVTDAPAIHARWTVRDKGLAMDHMPATGVSGLDLYVRDGDVWRWIGTGRPKKVENEQQLAAGIPEGRHLFMVNLPLYNGLTSLEIGVPESATLEPAPPYPAERAKPILVYGTSITQGGCASRPGMAYPAILGRMLDLPMINLGFSGNGRMEAEVVELIAEIDAAVYVIDCAPNMQPIDIADRAEPLVRTLRAAHPDTPIVLVENIRYQAGAFLPETRKRYTSKNDALRAAYQRLVDSGVQGLHYVPCDELFGDDGEATVDGTHATDLGFLRMAEALDPVLRSALK